MKKIISLVLAAILCACTFSAFALVGHADTDAVLFVKQGGTGDGKTLETAMGDLGTAIETLAEDGGTIVISGTYDVTGSWCMTETTDGNKTHFSEPAHEGHINITGRHDGVNYKATLKFGKDNNYLLSGPTTIDYLTIDGSNTFLIAARYNELTIGYGVDVSAVRSGAYIVGGYNNKDVSAIDASTGINYAGEEERDGNINVGSGTWLYVVAQNRYLNTSRSKVTYKNTVTMNFFGDAVVEKLILGAYEGSVNEGGTTIVNVTDDAAVADVYTDTKRDADVGIDSFTINLRSEGASCFSVTSGLATETRELYYIDGCALYPSDADYAVKFTKTEKVDEFDDEMPTFEEKKIYSSDTQGGNQAGNQGTNDNQGSQNGGADTSDVTDAAGTTNNGTSMDTTTVIVIAAAAVAVILVAVTVVVIIKRRNAQ